MNLFRSKEDVITWSEFKPGTKDGILPIAICADLLSTPRHSGRLNPQYVSTAPDTTGPPSSYTCPQVTEGSPYWNPKLA